MPIYEYDCQKCGKAFEIMQKITDSPLCECADCGGALKKRISSTSFVLKGTGWYATDYAAPSKKIETDSSPKAAQKSANEGDKTVQQAPESATKAAQNAVSADKK